MLIFSCGGHEEWLRPISDTADLTLLIDRSSRPRLIPHERSGPPIPGRSTIAVAPPLTEGSVARTNVLSDLSKPICQNRFVNGAAKIPAVIAKPQQTRNALLSNPNTNMVIMICSSVRSRCATQRLRAAYRSASGEASFRRAQ
jgi:hypothetical protein